MHVMLSDIDYYDDSRVCEEIACDVPAIIHANRPMRTNSLMAARGQQ